MLVSPQRRMIKIKLCLVLILLTDVVEANVTYNVKCSGEGDVYIRPKSQVSNLASERFEFMFASSKDNVCNQQVTGDVVKIYGCLQVRFLFVLSYFYCFLFYKNTTPSSMIMLVFLLYSQFELDISILFQRN